MKNAEHSLLEHQQLTRRHFIRLGAAGTVTMGFLPLAATADSPRLFELVQVVPELTKRPSAIESGEITVKS